MNRMFDVRTLGLVGGVLAMLLVGHERSASGSSTRADSGLNPALVETFNLRIRAWWLMCTVLAAAFLLGPASHVATVILVRPDLVLGLARVHHAHAHAARRSPHAVLGLLPLHAAAVRAGRHGRGAATSCCSAC